MPCALLGRQHGTPALPGPPTPPHSPPFQEALHPGPPVFLWGNRSLVSRHLTMKTFSLCSSAHPGWAGSGVNTAIRGWTHPTRARLSSTHVPAAASAERGRAGLLEGGRRRRPESQPACHQPEHEAPFRTRQTSPWLHRWCS